MLAVRKNSEVNGRRGEWAHCLLSVSEAEWTWCVKAMMTGRARFRNRKAKTTRMFAHWVPGGGSDSILMQN